MGFNTIPHKPYYIIKEGVLIFFLYKRYYIYIQKDKTGIIKRVVRELKTKYQFINGGELQWFLGI